MIKIIKILRRLTKKVSKYEIFFQIMKFDNYKLHEFLVILPKLIAFYCLNFDRTI